MPMSAFYPKAYLLAPLLVLLLCTCGPAQKESGVGSQESGVEKPNILFLFTDDHAVDAVGALGNDIIQTPNLDRIINGGTTFTHAYNMGAWQPAVCLASRAMLNTGRSVWRAQALDARVKAGDEAAMADNWAPLMRRAGYATYFSGKWHVAAPATEQFETARHVRPGMPSDGYPFGKMNALKQRHAPNRPPLDSIRALFPPGYNRPLSPDDDSWDAADPKYGGFWHGGKHWSEVVGDDGVDFLQQAKDDDRPFFMYLAFNAPHDPRQAPQEYLDLYKVEDMPVPASFQLRYPYDEQIGLGPGVRDEDLAPYPRTKLAVQTHTREYYALISHLDAQVGRILEALDASGKADNTVVIFTADHGLAYGKHGLFGKQNLYDHSVRVPLAIKGPGFPVNRKFHDFVHLQDVMPTSLELAGADIPDDVEFRSLLPTVAGKEPGLPSVYLAYTDKQRAIRMGDHKLIIYPEADQVRLYDVNEDPEETTDLLETSAEPAGLVPEMRKELKRWQRKVGDPLQLVVQE